MTSIRRTFLPVAGVLLLVLLAPVSAFADSYDDSFDSGDDGFDTFFSVFIVIFVLAVVIGIGSTIWKVSTARRLAEQSGMDPKLATQMTLLSDHGLDETYLAANLRGAAAKPVDPATSPGATGTAAERLTELKTLLDASLITQAEYDTRRAAIVDGL